MICRRAGLVPVRGAQGRGSPGDQGEYHHQHRFCGGSQQNSKTITFNLPDSGEIVSVQVIDSSGNTVWGPEEKDTNLEVAVEVTVSGSGTEEFTLLVNGSAYSTKTVDFEAE